MIAYFDTSAFIPLVVDEPGSEVAASVWGRADRVASVRLLYVEARAALARAWRLGRLSDDQLRDAVTVLADLYEQVDRIEIDGPLVRQAGELTGEQGLRGYDAVHLAAAARLAGRDTVFISGDQAQCDAAHLLGLAIAHT